MTIEDEKLDELLRDVGVPCDLKASLLQIPGRDCETQLEVRRPISRSRFLAWVAGIAAMLLLFCALMIAKRGDQGGLATKSNDEESEVIQKEDMDFTSMDLVLAKMERNLEDIARIQQLQNVGIPISDTYPRNGRVELRESIALAMSLSWKSSLDQGASIASVRPELEYVVNTFPNTRGAAEAQSILQHN